MKLKNGTIIIDLNKSEEDLWKEVQKDNRWSVNKAKKEGIVVKEGGNEEECYDLYLNMCSQNKLISVKKNHMFSDGKLLTALKDNKIVAFSIVKEDNGKALLRFNASDYEYRQTQANSILYWDTILHYKRKGFKEIDLGGVDLHSEYSKGRDVFKERWGGKLIKKEHEISVPEYIWWRYLRHYSILRNLKYVIQTKILGK